MIKRAPRTFYEYLKRKKVEANKAVTAAGHRARADNSLLTRESFNASNELNSRKSEFYLVVDILRTYQDFRTKSKSD